MKTLETPQTRCKEKTHPVWMYHSHDENRAFDQAYGLFLSSYYHADILVGDLRRECELETDSIPEAIDMFALNLKQDCTDHLREWGADKRGHGIVNAPIGNTPWLRVAKAIWDFKARYEAPVRTSDTPQFALSTIVVETPYGDHVRITSQNGATGNIRCPFCGWGLHPNTYEIPPSGYSRVYSSSNLAECGDCGYHEDTTMSWLHVRTEGPGDPYYEQNPLDEGTALWVHKEITENKLLVSGELDRASPTAMALWHEKDGRFYLSKEEAAKLYGSAAE